MFDYKNIPDLFIKTVCRDASKNIFNYKSSGKWIGLSGKKIFDTVENISASLKKCNINAKDKVAILSSTSYKWALVDYGIICNGSTTVTVYPTLIEKHVEYILNDSESKLIFVEDESQKDKVLKIAKQCPKLQYIVVMDNSNSINNSTIINFNEFCNDGCKFKIDSSFNIKSIVNKINNDDLVTLIYTSGTTGLPKGVMLTHNNLISNIKAVLKVQENIKNEIFLSFLPLSHVLERMAGHFFAMATSSKIYYAENMETVGENMIEVSPTVVICVPRVFEKIYAKIMTGLKNAPKNKIKLFNWALNVGKDYVSTIQSKHKVSFKLSIKYFLANKLIYKKVQSKFGGKIKFFISGGAPLSIDIAEFFAGIGIIILEGYGLTETSPVLTSNTPNDMRFGTVGKKLYNVDIKIAKDGEILAKGPNIMLGYYNNEEATKESIDENGWFHTGDIGEIDQDGFLKITDRKKSLIVTSAGKNIAPAPLENSIKSSDYIDQVLVLGDKRNFISALIVPDFNTINTYLNTNNIDSLSNEAIVDHPEVIKLIDKEVSESMKEFSQFETIKKFKLCARPFTIEQGELTPKQSIVRKKVLENFNDLIESMYK